jgi:hypothetical protein
MPTTTGTLNDRKPNSISSSKSIPTWLPISFVRPHFMRILPIYSPITTDADVTLQLAVTTAALAVPIVLLRRQRSKALLNQFLPRRGGDSSSLTSRSTPIPSIPSSDVNGTQWPPPRRKSSGTMPFQGSRLTPRVSSVSASLPAVELDEVQVRLRLIDGFNAPLYTAKAFGLATLIVAVCASAAVWGVKNSLDLKNVRRDATVLAVTDLHLTNRCRLQNLQIECDI